MPGKREYVVVVGVGYVKKLIATQHCVLIRYLPLFILAVFALNVVENHDSI